MNIENSETIYKSLIKINQIGKKLASHSNYILSNGILLGYTDQEMSDTEANPISVAFIDKKLHEKIEGIGDKIGLLINGNELYSYSQEYEFDSMTLNDNGIRMNFVYYSINNDSYENNFKKLLKEKGFNDNEIEYNSGLNYTNNIDMYDLYLKYKKEYTPEKEKTYIYLDCKFVKTNNSIYKKSEKVIEELLYSECMYDEEIEREILDFIINARQPVIRTCELDNNEKMKIRLMKSLFNPISSKNPASISIYKSNKKYFLVSKIESTGITIFNIFRILKY